MNIAALIAVTGVSILSYKVGWDASDLYIRGAKRKDIVLSIPLLYYTNVVGGAKACYKYVKSLAHKMCQYNSASDS